MTSLGHTRRSEVLHAGPPSPVPHAAAEIAFWPLDARYDFLNHGSFGSVPYAVQEAQRRYAAEVEAQPIEVLGRQCRARLSAVRDRLARFLGADAAGLGLVTNATDGINGVLRSLRLSPGDVLVTTDHVYYAVIQAMRFAARRCGAEVRVVPVPTPVRSESDVIGPIAAAIDARTRIVVADHVTSPTAIVFPARAIAELCRSCGVEFLCDGAHAPGMLDLSIADIGATYYAGNLHKWTCAPKGSGFLWVDPHRRGEIHPATVSHFLDGGFDVEFDWQGTRDISAWLAVPDALDLWDAVGLERVRAHNRQLADWAGRRLAERWGTAPTVGLDGDRGTLLGSMAAVSLPEGLRQRFEGPEALQADLYRTDRIEVPIMLWNGTWLCRVSCQIYNRAAQYERLAEAIARRLGA